MTETNSADDDRQTNPDFLYDDFGNQIGQRLADRPLGADGANLRDYLRSSSEQNPLPVTRAIEQAFMSGGCTAYALAFIERNPHCVLAVDTYDDLSADEPTEMIDHVFCLDPATGRAYDIRGEFESAADLTDHAAEKDVLYDNPEHGMFESTGVREISKDELLAYVEHSGAIARHTLEDLQMARETVARLTPRGRRRTQ